MRSVPAAVLLQLPVLAHNSKSVQVPYGTSPTRRAVRHACVEALVFMAGKCGYGDSKAHLVLTTVGELLEDVTSHHAKVRSGQEVGTCPDQATVRERRQRSPLSIC